jgi:hypothetical protein
MATASKELLAETEDLIRRFDANVNRLQMPAVDPRVFFTIAHGYITKCIYANIDLFEAPDPLLRLNKDFATTFLRAIEGNPHDGWKRAFKVCSGLLGVVNSGIGGNMILRGGLFEGCAGCMANVHINRDLVAALTRERNVSPRDYGNVYIFVVAGNLKAEEWLRGRLMAAVVGTAGMGVGMKINLDFKRWRNDAFQAAYGVAVPNPEASFVSTVEKRGFARGHV